VACAKKVLTMLEPVFNLRGLKSELRAPEDATEVRVVAEASRLERVFYNLIQNAIRYSPRNGEISVSIAKEADGSVRLTVEDQGPGVPPEVAPQLFQKFVRHGNTQGKAGLGLFFCRITVEQWSGAIGCEPRAGGGTVFWFRLLSANPQGAPA
jgi:signal transduction histidine kinase